MAILAPVAGGLLAVGVAAHTTRHDSSLSLNAFTSGSQNNYFYGAVTSASSKCVERKVRVFRKEVGADEKYDSERSIVSGSGNGTYTVTAPNKGDLPQGTYYAQIKKRDLKPGNRHDHICRGAKSSEQSVGP